MTVNRWPNTTQWSIEHGYANETANVTNYPVRVYSTQRDAGLFVQLSLFDEDLETICSGRFLGYKIFLHVPGEVVTFAGHSYRVPISEEVDILIKPQMILTSPGLRSYRPDQRQCFFESERSLRFFKMYTKNNCESECLANFTLNQCDCVKFSMPSNLQTDQNF